MQSFFPALPKCQTKEYTLKYGDPIIPFESLPVNYLPQTGKRDSVEILKKKRSRILNATSLSPTLIAVLDSDFEQVSEHPSPSSSRGYFQADFRPNLASRPPRGLSPGENHLCSGQSSFFRLHGLNPGSGLKTWPARPKARS